MVTTKEFLKTDADNIINDLETFWTVQRDGANKYVRVPFPVLEEILEGYVNGLDDPWDDLSDWDDIPEDVKHQMIKEQKDRICKAYKVVQDIRIEFQDSIKK